MKDFLKRTEAAMVCVNNVLMTIIIMLVVINHGWPLL